MVDTQQILIGVVLAALSMGAIVLIVYSSRNRGIPSVREDTDGPGTRDRSTNFREQWGDEFTRQFGRRIGEDTLNRLETILPEEVITDVRERYLEYANVETKESGVPNGSPPGSASSPKSNAASTTLDDDPETTVDRLENDLRNEILNHLRALDTELESEFERVYEFPAGEYQLYLKQIGDRLIDRRKIDFGQAPMLTSQLRQSKPPLKELVDLLAQIESQRTAVIKKVRTYEDEFARLRADTTEIHRTNKRELESFPDPLGSWLFSVYYPGPDELRPEVDVEPAIQREDRQAALDDLHRCSFDAAIDGAEANRNRARDLNAVVVRLKVIFQRARRGVTEYEFSDFESFSSRFLTWQFLEALAPKVGETCGRTYDVNVDHARLRFQDYTQVDDPGGQTQFGSSTEPTGNTQNATPESDGSGIEAAVGPDIPGRNQQFGPDLPPEAAQRMSDILTQIQSSNGERFTLTESNNNIPTVDDKTRSVLEDFLADQDDIIEEWSVQPTGTDREEIVSVTFANTAEEPGFELMKRFDQLADRATNHDTNRGTRR